MQSLACKTQVLRILCIDIMAANDYVPLINTAEDECPAAHHAAVAGSVSVPGEGLLPPAALCPGQHLL